MSHSFLKAVAMARLQGTTKQTYTVLAVLIGAMSLPLLAFNEPLLIAVSDIYRTYVSSWWGRAGCGDNLTSLLAGRWEQQPMTMTEYGTIRSFLRYDREILLGMPKGLERKDKLCGNVTYEPTTQNPKIHLQFRALCNADGPTPCCFHNVCLNKTVEECTCADCIDLRTPIHAEYAVWRPTDPYCQPLPFSQQELCDLLDNSTIYFIGDSFVRHVYTAMLMTIRNDDKTGAFSDTMLQDIRDKCQGLYMFTEKLCRRHIALKASECENRVKIHFIEMDFNEEGSRLTEVVQKLKNKPRSLVFVGFGMHDMFNSLQTFTKSMKPVLDGMSAENWTWPLIVWSSMHSFGLLRKPDIPHQNTEDALRFNRETHELFGSYNSTPLFIFDTYNMTTNVTSFDGEHYATGVNKVKVNILMNFIWGRKRKYKW